MFVCILVPFLWATSSGLATDSPSPYLEFTDEPPTELMFLNTQGGGVPCKARGDPEPVTRWVGVNMTPMNELPGLRHLLPDGSLNFPPFQASDFDPTVHQTTYQCVATSPLGVLGSRHVHVIAVLKENIRVSVPDAYVVAGNTAVLHCHVPVSLRGYVKPRGWATDSGLTLASAPGDGAGYSRKGRYQTFPDGTLHIWSTDRGDGDRRYRCQVENTLTGERVFSSNWGRLQVTEAGPDFAPRAATDTTVWSVDEGGAVRVPCVAHGKPAPDYAWYRVRDRGGTEPADVRPVAGTLVIHHAKISDAGRYICVANNSLGEIRTEVTVEVKGKLRARLTSSRQQIRSGESVTLRCEVSGGVTRVEWTRDLRPLPTRHDPSTFTLPSFQRDHIGIYQCFVFGDYANSQSHVVLRIHEEAPSFIRIFPEQMHMPGDMLALQCSAIGSPLPRVTWTLDGGPIPPSRRLRQGDFVGADGNIVSFVNISGVAVPDGGMYGCEAHNKVGAIKHQAKIDVFGPPFIRPMNITAIAAKSVQLRCPVAGYPIDSVAIYRAGRRLTSADRYSLDDRGSLTIHNLKKDDAGAYRCSAVNGRGEKADGDLFLRVVAPPVVGPFLFADNLEEGMRTSAMCSVVDGDPPIAVRWLKDGHDLGSQRDIRVMAITEFASSIILDRLTRTHSGSYTCLASNPAASANFTAELKVKAAPQWTIRPADKSTLTGLPVIFDCQAAGQPRPVIRWKYSADFHPPSFQSILSSSHLHVLENGSLSLPSATKADVGLYQCEAGNEIGEPLRQTVRLSVHTAPRVHASPEIIHVRLNESASMLCSATGDHPLTISWTKNGFPLNFYTHTRYMVKESEGETKNSEVTLTRAERQDTDTYTCLARNAHGEDGTSVKLLVQEPPSAPRSLRPLEIASSSISLAWDTPSNLGNSPISSYILHYKTDKAEWSSSAQLAVSWDKTSATLNGLEPLTTYQVRLTAANALGPGPPCEPLSATTSMEAPRIPPHNVKVFPINSRSVRITWEWPKKRQHLVSGFYVGYKESGSGDQFVYKTAQVGMEDGALRVDHLKKGTKYTFVVQPYNEQGAGPPSKEVETKTFMQDPPKAPSLKVKTVTSTSVELFWGEIDETPISGYVISYKDEFGHSQEMQLPPTRSQYIFENLECGAGYSFQLVAFNEIGRGEPSEAVHISTDGRAPVAPPKQSFVRANVSWVELNLAAWSTETGGCPAAYFGVQYRATGRRDWVVLSSRVPAEPLVVVPDLPPATWHDLLVTAHTTAGARTEAEYRFATLALDGGTVPPLLLGASPPLGLLEDPAVLIPVATASAVLLIVAAVTLAVLLWRRRVPPDHELYSRTTTGRPDDNISMSSYGKSKAIFEQPREQLYYPLPYASSHVPPAGSEYLQENLQDRISLSQHHTYDVPHRVQVEKHRRANSSVFKTLDRQKI